MIHLPPWPVESLTFASLSSPAMDQIVNEMAKFRFRSGNQWNCGGVTLRAPCGAVSLFASFIVHSHLC
jgi:pyruvate/2-oxoglutarate/acetoin dehydrogenase E1 component